VVGTAQDAVPLRRGVTEMQPTPFRHRGAPTRNILDYLEVPLRRPLLVVGPFVFAVVASVAAGLLLPKKYMSTTFIMVESEKVPDSFVPKMATETTNKRLLTIKQEILSRTRLETVIQELNPYPEQASEPLSNTVETMRNAVTVTVKGTDAFSIDFVHRDPRTAMAVANRLASLFIEQATQAREAQVEGAYDFIDSQLQDSKKELEGREEALRRFKESHMGTLPEQMQANLATLQGLQIQQQTIAENLRGALDRESVLESAPALNPTLPVDAPTEISQLKAQLAALRLRYTDEHPDVQALSQRIASLERGLGDPVLTRQTRPAEPTARMEQLSQIRGEVASLKARRDDLDTKINALQARVEQAPRTEQDLATLTRDYRQLNDNYLALLNKKLEARMSEKLEARWKGEQFRVLDPAHLPERPFFPNRVLFLMMGIIAGLGLGLGTAYAAEFLDHSLKQVSDLESLFPLPVLAVIPHIGRQNAAGSEAR
jgi:polysaccharide chain length determinant protein (PEP-CTERM system associated)